MSSWFKLTFIKTVHGTRSVVNGMDVCMSDLVKIKLVFVLITSVESMDSPM